MRLLLRAGMRKRRMRMCKLRAAFDRLSGFYCEKWEGGNFDEPKEKEKGKEPQQSKPH